MTQCTHKSPTGRACTLDAIPPHEWHMNVGETWFVGLPAPMRTGQPQPTAPTLVPAPDNDCVCPACKNDRCRLDERVCWKCGAALAGAA